MSLEILAFMLSNDCCCLAKRAKKLTRPRKLFTPVTVPDVLKLLMASTFCEDGCMPEDDSFIAMNVTVSTRITYSSLLSVTLNSFRRSRQAANRSFAGVFAVDGDIVVNPLDGA